MQILKLFPTYLSEFTVNKSPNQIIAEIGSISERRKIIRFKKSSKKFEGEIGKSRFKLKRIIYIRDDFLPEICGYLIGNNIETTVVIKANPEDSLIVFSIVFFGFVIFASLILSIVGKIALALLLLLIIGGFIYINIWLGWLRGKEDVNFIENLIKR